MRSVVFGCMAFFMAYTCTNSIVGPTGIIATRELDAYIGELEDSVAYHRWVHEELLRYKQNLSQRTTLEDTQYDGEFLFPQEEKDPLTFHNNSPLAGTLTPDFAPEISTTRTVLPYITGILFGLLVYMVFRRLEKDTKQEEPHETV